MSRQGDVFHGAPSNTPVGWTNRRCPDYASRHGPSLERSGRPSTAARRGAGRAVCAGVPRPVDRRRDLAGVCRAAGRIYSAGMAASRATSRAHRPDERARGGLDGERVHRCCGRRAADRSALRPGGGIPGDAAGGRDRDRRGGPCRRHDGDRG